VIEGADHDDASADLRRMVLCWLMHDRSASVFAEPTRMITDRASDNFVCMQIAFVDQRRSPKRIPKAPGWHVAAHLAPEFLTVTNGAVAPGSDQRRDVFRAPNSLSREAFPPKLQNPL
jgi:hypothetical protein